MNSQHTIYIHIGTLKTGTTAIQDFLALNKNVLKAKGVLLPMRSRRHYYTRSDAGYFVTRTHHKHYRKLARLCRQKRSHVLISSEAFSLLEDVSNIKAFLDGMDVKIICYLRRQDSLIQSMYNQMVKRNAYYENISTFQLAWLDYDKLLDNWASVFGPENIIVRVYEKQHFLNNNLIEDFLDVLGLRLTDEYTMPKHNPNPRLSPAVLEYMRYINALIKDVRSSIKLKKSLIKFSAEKYSDVSTSIFFDHSLLTGDQKRSVLARFADSNSRVAKKYLKRQDGRLFYEELAQTPESSSPQEILTDEIFLEITRCLCSNRANKKNILSLLDKDVSEKDKFTKTAHSRFSDALKRIA